MGISKIILLDECSANNIINNPNYLIIFTNISNIYSFPFIKLESNIKQKCLSKPKILNNPIYILQNNIYNYIIDFINLSNKYLLPIIYIIEDKLHIFVTSFNLKINRSEQTLYINKYIDNLKISVTDKIIICGYFEYDFYINPAEISSLSNELYSHIPQIFDDKNNTKLNRYIFIRKQHCKKKIELNYENNICEYTI